MKLFRLHANVQRNKSKCCRVTTKRIGKTNATIKVRKSQQYKLTHMPREKEREWVSFRVIARDGKNKRKKSKLIKWNIHIVVRRASGVYNVRIDWRQWIDGQWQQQQATARKWVREGNACTWNCMYCDPKWYGCIGSSFTWSHSRRRRRLR